MNKRWVRWSLFLLPLAVLCSIWWKVIFAGQFFYNGDILFNYYPYLLLFAHHSPVIIQGILGGFPGFVSVTGTWFNPIVWIAVHLASPYNTYRYLTVLNMILVYLFTYLFARKISLSEAEAELAALVFMFSGQVMLWSTSLFMTSVYFLLPLSLYLLEIFFEQIGVRQTLAIVGSGAVLGLGWLTGQVQFVLYVHIFVVAYYLYRRRDLWPLVAMGIISLLVGMPQIIATLSFKSVTARASGVSVSDAFIGSYLPQNVVHFFLPFFNGPIPLGSPNLYIGIVPLLLLMYALIYRKRIGIRDLTFFAITYGICILTSVTYSPIAYILHKLPVFNSLREAPRVMLIGNFAAAMLVGFAVKHMSEHMQGADALRRRGRILTTALLVITAITATAAGIATLYFERIAHKLTTYFVQHEYAHTAHQPLAHYTAVIRQVLASFIAQFRVTNPSMVALWMSLVIVLAVLKLWNSIRPNVLVYIAIIATAGNFLLVFWGHYPTVTRYEMESFPRTAMYIQKIESDSNRPFRIYSILPNDTVYRELRVGCGNVNASDTLELEKEFTVPNSNLLYNLDSIDGYEPYAPANISNFVSSLGSENPPTGASLALEEITPEEKITRIAAQKSLLQESNVKYVISGEPIRDQDFIPIFQEQVGSCQVTIHVYQLRGSQPRYYQQTGTQKVILPVLYGSDTMEFHPDAAATSTLIVGNTWLPGWQATVDGKPVPIIKGPLVFMSVALTSGAHKVVFTYKTGNVVSWLLP